MPVALNSFSPTCIPPSKKVNNLALPRNKPLNHETELSSRTVIVDLTLS